MKYSVRSVLAVMALSICAACASVGVPPADTFNKKLAAGYVTVSAVADAATSAVNSGAITKADAAGVLAAVKAVEQGLDTAASIHATDAAAGDTKLQTAIQALTALQAYLASKGATK
jgi:hypothetical protein